MLTVIINFTLMFISGLIHSLVVISGCFTLELLNELIYARLRLYMVWYFCWKFFFLKNIFFLNLFPGRFK